VRRLAPLCLLALVGVPLSPLGAADFAEDRYDPEAAFAEELADLRAGLDNPEGRASALEWIDAELAEVQSEDARRALVQARFEALTFDEPLPEGYRGSFIASVAPAATLHDVTLGVPASVSIAQAIMESGWGRSAPGYNLFGIKGEGPAGSTVRKSVDYRGGKRSVRKTAFRAYLDAEGSMADHARILATSPRYSAAREVAEDPSAYARALQGTYASDPRYARKLVEIIELYGLDRFDWSVPEGLVVAEALSTDE
jgi:flagellum-specific peptidoglycan hydrolase FlgJ